MLTSKKVFPRTIWIVLDSVGIGAMPDAAAFGDPPHADTLGNIARLRGLSLPNLAALGLGNIKPLAGIAPAGSRGLVRPLHAGLARQRHHHRPLGNGRHPSGPSLPALPSRISARDHAGIRAADRPPFAGNKAASGTEIIQELGAEHMRTGSPIVYTSADSVFQVAAHEEVIPLWELYKICETARDILRGPAEVGRVIARPFVGAPGHFTRTANRHDYAVPPPPGMLLDRLAERGVAFTAWARFSTSFWAAESANRPRPRTMPTAWPRRWKPWRTANPA
jgi:phosphopentomutase